MKYKEFRENRIKCLRLSLLHFSMLFIPIGGTLLEIFNSSPQVHFFFLVSKNTRKFLRKCGIFANLFEIIFPNIFLFLIFRLPTRINKIRLKYTILPSSAQNGFSIAMISDNILALRVKEKRCKILLRFK